MTTILIKRYPNRKLYNMAAKRYITLDTISDLIREGYDVEVRDHETGEDLTGMTLSQIIFEREKKDSGYLPNALLTSLIRTGGDTLDYVRRSFQASIDAVRALESEVDQRLDSLVHRGKMAEEDARRLREEISRDRLDGLMDLQGLDNKVEAALHRLNIPSRVDLIQLQTQLEHLTASLDAVLASQEPASQENGDDKPGA